jgi:phosphoheptose isomerase
MDYLEDLAHVLAQVPGAALGRAIQMLLDARASGHRVYVMGNGGSSSTASHFVCDLVKTAHISGFEPLRVFSLTDNTPMLTAWSNDSAYEDCFSRQIEALVEADDVVIAISASGNSRNILEGLRAASARGAHTIALLGFDGGAAVTMADVPIHIPCHHYGLVEDTHSAIGHAITAALQRALRDEAAVPVRALNGRTHLGGLSSRC